MTKEQKNWIDNASYKDLLSHWRHASLGDVFFQGECGEYYNKVMKEKRSKITDEEFTIISKEIGW